MPKPRRSEPTSSFQPPFGSHRAKVVRAHGLWYEVKPVEDHRAGATIIATMKGQLKKQKRRTDIVAVGDWVWITDLPDNEAVIEVVEPRTSALIRTARHTRDTEQVILANPDQVLFTFAITNPEPHTRMLDRFIILAEMQEIPVHIAVNKIELATSRQIEEVFGIYRDLYPLHFVSAHTGEGIGALRQVLQGKTTAVAGPSGVGKSTLLNAIDPQHRRDTGDISDATGKGRHTTIGSRLFEIDDDTWVADTPGMRALAMHAVDPTMLDHYFIEFRPFLGECYYQDCTHVHEPSCAVKEAVESGHIAPERYASYVSLRAGEELTQENP
ncbi:MAG: ribosome small subunit-dependent GTPase A [Thermomicrobiales bacterium]|nr:ribosome small subunit-dependent GTPase A [Thermomicrobiales bacterium]MCO5227882.1 ribosome small subunit-dependent GTPase A [Thermomicrobiales bacterium]